MSGLQNAKLQNVRKVSLVLDPSQTASEHSMMQPDACWHETFCSAEAAAVCRAWRRQTVAECQRPQHMLRDPASHWRPPFLQDSAKKNGSLCQICFGVASGEEARTSRFAKIQADALHIAFRFSSRRCTVCLLVAAHTNFHVVPGGTKRKLSHGRGAFTLSVSRCQAALDFARSHMQRSIIPAPAPCSHSPSGQQLLVA